MENAGRISNTAIGNLIAQGGRSSLLLMVRMIMMLIVIMIMMTMMIITSLLPTGHANTFPKDNFVVQPWIICTRAQQLSRRE